MSDSNHVEAAASHEAGMLEALIVPTGQAVGGKQPVFRVQVMLPAPLDGVYIEAPIFASATGKGGVEYTVGLPGGRFPCLKPVKATIQANGRRYRLQDDDPAGLQKLTAWEPAIKAALLDYLRTQNPEQVVAF